jgi:hypothetical protein
MDRHRAAAVVPFRPTPPSIDPRQHFDALLHEVSGRFQVLALEQPARATFLLRWMLPLLREWTATIYDEAAQRGGRG